MTISSTKTKDVQYIGKLKKVTDYAQNITNQFKVRINKIDEFH